MIVDGYLVQPLRVELFDDFTQVIGKGGIGGCWCMYWTLPSSKAWGEGAKGGGVAKNRESFLRIVETGPPPGLLAYDREEPVAWCRVVPRLTLPGLANSRYFKTDLDIAGVWSLPCFVVRKPYRGRGLTATLTKAAIEFVREQGGTIVEAYPWDTEEKKADDVVYTGSGVRNQGQLHPEPIPWNGRDHSIGITVPPLAAVFYRPVR